MIRPPPATPLTLNLAPMVDVMMCLLIFFMLATKMVEQEISRVDLPTAAAAKEADRRSLGNRLVINVRRSGGRDQPAYLIGERELTMDAIRERLRSESRNDPQVNCVIRADRHTPYRDVEAILSSCQKAGVRQITLAAERVEGGG